MARKNTVNYQVASNQSLSSAFTSVPTEVITLDNLSYQINITTTDSVGTFAVQASDDYATYEPSGVVTNSGTWYNLPLGGGTPFANMANDTINIYLNQVAFKALRIAYTPSVAGTGVCNIFVTAKQLGG